jgi:hypothetical protein
MSAGIPTARATRTDVRADSASTCLAWYVQLSLVPRYTTRQEDEGSLDLNFSPVENRDQIRCRVYGFHIKRSSFHMCGSSSRCRWTVALLRFENYRPLPSESNSARDRTLPPSLEISRQDMSCTGIVFFSLQLELSRSIKEVNKKSTKHLQHNKSYIEVLRPLMTTPTA